MLNRAEAAVAGVARTAEDEQRNARAIIDVLAGRLPPAGIQDANARRAVEQGVSNEVRVAQQHAAAVRAAWNEATQEERARRMACSGGATGKAWRRAALAAWQTKAEARPTPTQPPTPETKAQATRRRKQEKEGGGRGWTVAQALIWHMRARGRKTRAERREEGKTDRGEKDEREEEERDATEGATMDDMSTAKRKEGGIENGKE